MIKILLDVMGTDNGPEGSIQGVSLFLPNHDDAYVVLVGDAVEIRKWTTHYNINPNQFEIVHTVGVINPGEGVMAVRRKQGSSMVKALTLMKNGNYDCVISSGSTPAYVAGCHFILGEMAHVTRPGYMAFSPSLISGRFFAMLDVGANLKNTPEELLRFAVMSDVYMRIVYNIDNPRVGLLNIGTESSKGLPHQVAAYKLMQKEKSLNFIGNVESRNLLLNICDIMVSDGYTGNIFLKTYEGTGLNLLKRIRQEFHSGFVNKIKGLLVRSVFKGFMQDYNYKKYAAAIVLGCDKLAIKTHGSVDAESMVSALELAYRSSKAEIIKKIKEKLGQ